MATAPSHPATRPFAELLLDFLAYLELERGLSRNTLEAYRSDLQQFGAFLERERTGPLDADHKLLAKFFTRLASGGPDRPAVTSATVQRKVACLRSFYRHLRREGILERDPTADLRAPKRSQRLPQVLTRGEVARLPAQPAGTSASTRTRAPDPRLRRPHRRCDRSRAGTEGFEIIPFTSGGSGRQSVKASTGIDRPAPKAEGQRT